MYAYKDDGQYYIASYDTLEPLNNNKYDYIISINDIIITFNNKQINILDNHLQSKLLIPINTYYAYKTEKERDTLKIEVKDNYISFSVYINDSTHKNYIYDTNNNKLYN